MIVGLCHCFWIKSESLKSALQIKNVYVMKQKLCFHAVKAMLLHGRFRHIAAENKAVLLSKTVVSACFYAEITAQNLCGVRNVL